MATPRKRKKATPRVTVRHETIVAIKGWWQGSANYYPKNRGEAATFTGKAKNGELTLTTECGGQAATFKIADLRKLIEKAEQKVEVVA